VLGIKGSQETTTARAVVPTVPFLLPLIASIAGLLFILGSRCAFDQPPRA
jgi:hypothetical protein